MYVQAALARFRFVMLSVEIMFLEEQNNAIMERVLAVSIVQFLLDLLV